MNQVEKQCIISIFQARYSHGGKKEKGQILDEVCERLRVGRRQARRLLEKRPPGRPRKPETRGRPRKYGDPEFTRALRGLWKTTRYMCSRHLKAAIPYWIVPVEQEKGSYAPEIRQLLLSVSAPTIDRILKPWKASKGKSLTRGGGFRDQIPIQESVWNIELPGYLEADTVAHCGGSTMGEYINTLTMVDIATTWIEARAVFGKGSTPIVHAIEDIEQQLPFDILGYDCDNGTEVLNSHVLRYFRDERIERGRPPVHVTRSREYKKNDNAHVEQKNNSVARRWLGYERLGHRELTALVNYYLRDIICPLMNHFFPSFKLADKIRVKSRTRRVYRDPVTPYARVMASPHVDQQTKQRLKEQHEKLNPLRLLKLEASVRRQIDGLLKALNRGEPTVGLLSVPPLAPCFSPSPLAAQAPTPPRCSPPPIPEGAAPNRVSLSGVLSTHKSPP
jgi:hypothetical protein